MSNLPDIIGIAQYGIAIVFIWLFWQERIALIKCYEDRVSEQKNHNDSLMALILCDDSELSEPQRALKRQFDRYRPPTLSTSPPLPKT